MVQVAQNNTLVERAYNEKAVERKMYERYKKDHNEGIQMQKNGKIEISVEPKKLDSHASRERTRRHVISEKNYRSRKQITGVKYEMSHARNKIGYRRGLGRKINYKTNEDSEKSTSEKIIGEDEEVSLISNSASSNYVILPDVLNKLRYSSMLLKTPKQGLSHLNSVESNADTKLDKFTFALNKKSVNEELTFQHDLVDVTREVLQVGTVAVIG